jgi:hypothetical protein
MGEGTDHFGFEVILFFDFLEVVLMSIVLDN